MKTVKQFIKIQDKLEASTKYIVDLIRPFNQDNENFPPEALYWFIDYLEIVESCITITWTRHYSGDSEEYRFSIPAEYYDLTDDEVIKLEKEKSEKLLREKQEAQTKVEQARAEELKRRELAQLAALKAKYEPQE